jgi:hypothetical protein
MSHEGAVDGSGVSLEGAAESPKTSIARFATSMGRRRSESTGDVDVGMGAETGVPACCAGMFGSAAVTAGRSAGAVGAVGAVGGMSFAGEGAFREADGWAHAAASEAAAINNVEDFATASSLKQR